MHILLNEILKRLKLIIDLIRAAKDYGPQLNRIEQGQTRIEMSLNHADQRLSRVEESIEVLLFMHQRPGPLKIVVTSEVEGKKDMATFKVVFPAAAKPSHTDHRELSVSVAGGEPDVRILTVDDGEEEGYVGQFGDSVHASLVDIDASGNRSEASTLDAVLADTFPPPKPGDMVLEVTSEDDPVPPVEPEPEV